MTNYLKLRHNTWSVRLAVPKDARASLGRREFQESLHTHDKRVAEARAMGLLSQWKSMILAARGNQEAVVQQAVAIRMADRGRINPDTGMSEADYYADDLATKLPDDKRQTFYEALSGKSTPLTVLLDDYLKGYQVEAKTKAMAKSAIEEVAEKFKTIEAISKKGVLNWTREDPRKKTTLNKNLGFVRSYWKYLQEQELVQESMNPFSALMLKDKAKAASDKRAAFVDADIPKLLKAAQDAKDPLLADLIKLAAYTGARLEELCSLRVDDVGETDAIRSLKISDAKSDAGNRVVPIHPELTSLVDHLVQVSTDGFLIHGQSPSKYGDRSNAIGKRFGRLKTRLKYGPNLVFHSIRKTVTTQLENKGVTEGIAADLIGHEKATITYGLYSAGTSMARKLEAISLIAYPLESSNSIASCND